MVSKPFAEGFYEVYVRQTVVVEAFIILDSDFDDLHSEEEMLAFAKEKFLKTHKDDMSIIQRVDEPQVRVVAGGTP